MQPYKKWTIYVLSFIMLSLSSIAGMNYVVDPYGIYHFAGREFNYQKSVESDPYLIKAFQVKKYEPDAIVLGTSRAMRLNPPFIESLTGWKTYNLGLSAANPKIDLAYLEYTMRVDNNLKTVFLGLDFEVFDNNYPDHANFKEARLSSFFYTQDLFASLLSEKALIDSRKVLTDNLRHTANYTENRYLGDGSFDENLVYPPNANEETVRLLPTKFQLSSKSLMNIQKIKELCDQNNIKLYVYISPVHAIVLETFWQNGLWSQFEDWKRQVTAIVPIWDFSGYHDISMSSLHDRENYNDLSHFSKKIGNLMLYRMLDKNIEQVPSYFGIRLTPDNIETHLIQLRADREQWPQRDHSILELINNY
ncbi:hypothetical protein [Paenibacillus sp. y28]|uniref:hypothetical protein n=1 Tax=Paenibacillus sp. y28 TaxID=3129110 RepID=UPI00301716A7